MSIFMDINACHQVKEGTLKNIRNRKDSDQIKLKDTGRKKSSL